MCSLIVDACDGIDSDAEVSVEGRFVKKDDEKRRKKKNCYEQM